MSDYDYIAARKAGIKPDEFGHWPDTYKTPEHITYSTDSVIKGGVEPGEWSEYPGKAPLVKPWQFRPSPGQILKHGKQSYQRYFKGEPRDSVDLSGYEDDIVGKLNLKALDKLRSLIQR